MFAGGAATAAAADDACSNAAIRSQQSATQLPDCRAYEQVSPIEKNNNHIGLEHLDGNEMLSPFISDPEGGNVLYASYGSFAGAPSQNVGNGYASSRGAEGWDTTPLTPPIYPYAPLNNVDVWGTTPDFSKQLVHTGEALAPGTTDGDRHLYIHDNSGDSYELVASWGPQDTLGVNLHFGGVSDDGERWFFALDGNKVLPTTPTAGCTLGVCQNMYEYSNGSLKLISVLPNGTGAPGGVFGAGNPNNDHVARRGVSDDGSRVYWSAFTGGNQGESSVYLTENGQTTLVTTRETDTSEQVGRFWFAEPDGSSAFLTSSGQLTADASPSGKDLYRYDADTADLVDLTPTASSAGVEAVLGTSDDGSYVYFQATGDLAPGATAGQHNVYVWHNGSIRLIATSPSGVAAVGGSLQNSITDFRVSPNGLRFAFLIAGALTGPHPQPDPGSKQAYLYDYTDDNLQCASCPQGGTPSSEVIFQFLGGFVGDTVAEANREGLTRNVLDDGRVLFTTATPLVSRDTNQTLDVYQYFDGEVSLVSTGTNSEKSFFADASRDGEDVFFLTLSKLVTQDQDSLYDLYTARVNGGLESQMPVKEPTCQGDACQGEPSGKPADEQPGSGLIEGDGNAKPAPSCLSQESKADKKADRAKKAQRKAKKAQRKAKKASGKKAKKLKRKAKKAKRKAKKARRAANQAKRQLNNCRSSK